jgi:hypothetical protein
MHLLQNPDYVRHMANAHMQQLQAEAADYHQARSVRRANRVRALVSRTLIAAGESLA